MLRSILGIGLLLASPAGVAPAADPGRPPVDVKCGAYCVFVGLKALGLAEGPYSAFEKTIDPPGPAGYSMEALDRIAASRGASTLAVEADLETLATLSRPSACIAFADQHFLIIKWVNPGTKTVTLIDPPREYDQSFDEFRRRFSKRSLILGTPAIPPALTRPFPGAVMLGWASATVAVLALLGGLLGRKSRRGATVAAAVALAIPATGCGREAKPSSPAPRSPGGLRVDPAEHHLGKVFVSTPDRKITLESRLVNEPGPDHRFGTMLVSVRPGGEPGDYHQGVSVILRCRGIDRAKLDLPVTWSVRPTVGARPARLWLGPCRSGSSVTRRIALRSNDGPSPQVARLSGEPPGFLADSKVSGGSDGTVAVDLTFAISGDPGIRRGALTIVHGGADSRPLVVPVSYLIPAPSPAEGISP